MNLAMVRQDVQNTSTGLKESTALAKERYVAFTETGSRSCIVGIALYRYRSLGGSEEVPWIVIGTPQEKGGMESPDKPISLLWEWGFQGVSVSGETFSKNSTRMDAREANIWWNSIYWKQLKTKLSFLHPLPYDSILQVSRRIRQLARVKMSETQISVFAAGYDEMLRPESVEGFCRFLAKIKRPKTPELSVTNNGNIYARWRESSTRKFSLEFLSEKQAKFILFSPSVSQPGAIRYNKGLEDVDTILDVLSPYRIMDLLT